jgi:antitoxin MazE
MQARIELQVGKWGNSLGIRLPRHIADLLNLSLKDRMSCSVEDGKLVLERIRQPKYTLEELLADVEELGEEVSWGKPQGKEAW